MKCVVAIRPKPPPEKPAPQIPIDDVEATALALAEMMSPAKRRELARLLIRER
jgi:hypothetical protein